MADEEHPRPPRGLHLVGPAAFATFVSILNNSTDLVAFHLLKYLA